MIAVATLCGFLFYFYIVCIISSVGYIFLYSDLAYVCRLWRTFPKADFFAVAVEVSSLQGHASGHNGLYQEVFSGYTLFQLDF